MIKIFFSKKILVLLMMTGSVFYAIAQMTPQQAIGKMTCGINVGRSLELPNEGESGSRFIQEYYFEDFKVAGFNFVRIPIQWDQHTGSNSPYPVNEAWLKRVEQVVDWSLKHGIIVIINSHHDRWILEDANFTVQERERFVAIWTQIATYFKDKSDSLLFEIANEPNGLSISQINSLNADVIATIRTTNPTRIIVYSGNSYTGVSQMKSAAIPNDKYIMGTFHSYDPWNFAGLGKGTWGTASDINEVKSRMSDAASWSAKNNIPVILGEFGTIGKCDAVSRMKWFYNYLLEARRKNIAPAVWSDFGDFGIYNNTLTVANKWNNTIKDIIVYTHPLSAELLTITIKNISDAQLSWTNRAIDYKWIRIERKEGSGSYQSISTLDGNVTSYLDTLTISEKKYTYRIVCELSTDEITYSFPVEKKIEAQTTSSLSKEENSIKFNAYIANNELIIKTNFRKSNSEIFYRVFNLTGQIVKSGSFRTDFYCINTSNIPKGTYLILVVNTDGKISSMKVAN